MLFIRLIDLSLAVSLSFGRGQYRFEAIRRRALLSSVFFIVSQVDIIWRRRIGSTGSTVATQKDLKKRIPTVMIPTIERTVATVVAALLKERNKKEGEKKVSNLGNPFAISGNRKTIGYFVPFFSPSFFKGQINDSITKVWPKVSTNST